VSFEEETIGGGIQTTAARHGEARREPQDGVSILPAAKGYPDGTRAGEEQQDRHPTGSRSRGHRGADRSREYACCQKPERAEGP
jgi:hypothetical protein